MAEPEVFRAASDEAAEKIIEERELSEGSRFFVRKRKLAGVTSVTSLHDLRIKFEDAGRDTVPVIYEGVPFVVISCDMKECQYGPNRHKSKKELEYFDHVFAAKRRRHIQTSKKMDCEAKVKLRRIIRFPDYKIQGIDSQWKRRSVSRKLREEFGSTTTQMSDYCNRLDKKVIKSIQTMAQQGTTNVAHVQRRCNDLAEDIVPEHSKNDRRFFPTRKDVYNHIYNILGDTRANKNDQVKVAEIIDEWRSGNEGSHIFFRPMRQSGWFKRFVIKARFSYSSSDPDSEVVFRI